AHVAGPDLRIRRDDPGDLVATRAYFEGAAAETIEHLAIDVRNQVAEAIDAQDRAMNRRPVRRRLRNLEPADRAGCAAERAQLEALRERARRRREPIAPFERAADGRARVAALAQLDDFSRRMIVEYRGQYTVVRRDELVVAGLGGNSAPARSDPRI